jgi:head-tail adaptor
MPLSARIAAGKLRWRITIVKPTGSQDSLGGVPQDSQSLWEPVLTCWASIESLSGKDVHATDSFVEQTTHRVTIRNPRFSGNPNPSVGDPDQGITSQMLVWFKSRTFQILAVLNPDETNKKLILMCNEINQSNQLPPTPATS